MSDAGRMAQTVVDRLLDGREHVAVLEAGCGSATRIALPRGAVLTGIDISMPQLRRNTRLDHKVCADLECSACAEGRFDLVICWDVLEHLRRPAQALRGLIAATAPGGVVVLAIPNRHSLKGMLTRITPYAFHVWFYRYMMGDRGADIRSRQFPTYLRPDIGAARLRSTIELAGCEVAYVAIYEGPVQAELRRRNRLAGWFFASMGSFARAFTLGAYDPNLTDIILVARKVPAPSR